MKKVYLITRGCHDSYEITHIFKSKKKAEDFYAMCDYPDLNEIEEFELSDYDMPEPIEYIECEYAIMNMLNEKEKAYYASNQFKYHIKKTNSNDYDVDDLYDTRLHNGILELKRPIVDKSRTQEQFINDCIAICEEIEEQINFHLNRNTDVETIEHLFKTGRINYGESIRRNN